MAVIEQGFYKRPELKNTERESQYLAVFTTSAVVRFEITIIAFLITLSLLI